MMSLETVDSTGVEVRTLRHPHGEKHGEAHVEVLFDSIALTDPRWTGSFEPARLRLSRADARLLASALLEAAS